MKRVSVIFGTRPEAIKLCPLVLALRRYPGLDPHVCVTAQHRQMLDQVLHVFDVKPDVDLDIMKPGQRLASLSAKAIEALDAYMATYKPDVVLVQGDTTTVLCAAMVAFYNRIPLGHVEAGLRTWDLDSPYPEEANRVLTTRLADYHFAPTESAKSNLLRESVNAERVFVTGNTIVDALRFAVEKTHCEPPDIPGLSRDLIYSRKDEPLVLITAHRRESFGKGLESICKAIAALAKQFAKVHFVYPVHLNPNVRLPVHALLSGHANVHLIDPLGYLPFVALMDRSKFILTDSGGIQEEAPSIGKPVLVMRDTTERPEGVKMGLAKLVGTNVDLIINSAARLINDEPLHDAVTHVGSPYGDGHACDRIIEAIRDKT